MYRSDWDDPIEPASISNPAKAPITAGPRSGSPGRKPRSPAPLPSPPGGRDRAALASTSLAASRYTASPMNTSPQYNSSLSVRIHSSTSPVEYIRAAKKSRISHALAKRQAGGTTTDRLSPSQSVTPRATKSSAVNTLTPPISPGGGHWVTTPGMSVRHIEKYAGSV